jgi:hypothetical protein
MATSATSGDDDLRHADGEATAGSSGTGLTRTTLNLRRPTIEALDRIAAVTGASRTDNMNTAVLLYDLVIDIMARNGGPFTILMDNGDIERIHIL